jgi:hypothetical protein
MYLRDVTKANEAYGSHEGPKVLVRYEDLRADTLGEMRRVCLARAVKKHFWESIPEKDLTPEQARVVEEITRPILEAFYPDA